MPIKFSWLLNGRDIRDVVGIKVGSFGKKTSFLGIDALSEEHAGNYTCIAENRAGVSSYTANLIVKGISTAFSNNYSFGFYLFPVSFNTLQYYQNCYLSPSAKKLLL